MYLWIYICCLPTCEQNHLWLHTLWSSNCWWTLQQHISTCTNIKKWQKINHKKINSTNLYILNYTNCRSSSQLVKVVDQTICQASSLNVKTRCPVTYSHLSSGQSQRGYEWFPFRRHRLLCQSLSFVMLMDFKTPNRWAEGAATAKLLTCKEMSCGQNFYVTRYAFPWGNSAFWNPACCSIRKSRILPQKVLLLSQ